MRGRGLSVKWVLIALLFVSATAVADAYVAIPASASHALYFPEVETVTCLSAVKDQRDLVSIKTDQCRPALLQTIVVEGQLLLLDRPVDQLLESCQSLHCELREMPDDSDDSDDSDD